MPANPLSGRKLLERLLKSLAGAIPLGGSLASEVVGFVFEKYEWDHSEPQIDLQTLRAEIKSYINTNTMTFGPSERTELAEHLYAQVSQRIDEQTLSARLEPLVTMVESNQAELEALGDKTYSSQEELRADVEDWQRDLIAWLDSRDRPGTKVDYSDEHTRHAHGLVGRETFIETMESYLFSKAGEPRRMILFGDAGHGKSAIMNLLILEARGRGDRLAYHLAGGHIHDPELVVRSLVWQLAADRRVADEARHADSASVEGALNMLRGALRAITEPVTLFIDGLDEYSEPAPAPSPLADYLAKELPEHVRLLVASRPLLPHATRLKDVLGFEPIDLSDPKHNRETRKAINEYLALQQHKLGFDNDTLNQAANYAQSSFLHATLQLMIWRQDRRARQALSQPRATIQDMIQGEGDRMQRALAVCGDRTTRQEVERLLLFLGLARQPLTLAMLGRLADLDPASSREVLDHLEQAFLPFLSSIPAVHIYGPEAGPENALAPHHQAIRDHFTRQSKHLRRHQQLKPEEAQQAHQAFATRLGDWESTDPQVSKYALRHAPTHLRKAQVYDGLVDLLTGLRYVEARCVEGQVYELMGDNRRALASLPENQENIQKENARQECLDKWAQDLVAYAKGESTELVIIESIPPREEAELDAEQERMASQPTRLDRLSCFAGFLRSESHNLINYGAEAGFCLCLAYNHANAGPVARTADMLINTMEIRPHLLSWPAWRPPFNPHPACLTIREEHTNWVMAVAMSADGRRAVSASRDNTLRLWDLEQAKCLATLQGHRTGVMAVSMGADGRRAISASDDNTLRFWDLEQTKCLTTLERHTQLVKAVAMSADGRRAVSASHDNTLRFWDLEQAKCLATLQGHTDWVIAVAMSADGRRAVSASRDLTLCLWDLEQAKCLATLQGHRAGVVAVAITSDGQQAVSASYDHTLRLWDLEQAKCLAILQGHADKVRAVPMSADGRRAVSASRDKTLRLWDLEQTKCLAILEGHMDWVEAVSMGADGRRAVSASRDHTLRLWDLEQAKCLATLQRRTQLWGPEQAACVATLERHTQLVKAVSMNSDGQRAVSASTDNTLRLWDLEEAKCLATLEGHTEWIVAVVMSADGRRAVSASYDKTLRYWDLDQAKCLAVAAFPSPIECCQVMGDVVVAGGEDGQLRVLWLEG